MIRPFLCLSLIVVSPAATAQPPAAGSPPATPDATVDARDDSALRMSVPVTIGGAGPFHFIVDTGADRSVIARDLADRLGLPDGPTVRMTAMSGTSRVATVRLGPLMVGGAETRGIAAPALDRANLGADGLLGIDALAGRRIVLDFEKRTLTIAPPGTRERIDPDMIVVTAKSRYGQLVLVDADLDGLPLTVIVDTGAQGSIGNAALRRVLARKRRSIVYHPSALFDVTGATIPADVALVPRVRIGGVTLDQVGIAFAEVEPFRRFGLEDRPAMLLGVNTMRGFRRVSVDFAQRRVRFLLPPGVRLRSGAW